MRVPTGDLCRWPTKWCCTLPALPSCAVVTNIWKDKVAESLGDVRQGQRPNQRDPRLPHPGLIFLGCIRPFVDDAAADLGHDSLAAPGTRNCHAEIKVVGVSVVPNACGAACFHSVFLDHPPPFPLIADQLTQALSTPTKTDREK